MGDEMPDGDEKKILRISLKSTTQETRPELAPRLDPSKGAGNVH